jgi:hypothetical protein
LNGPYRFLSFHARTLSFVGISAGHGNQRKNIAMPRKTQPAQGLVMQSDGTDLFLRLDGKIIAKRGHPGTLHARQWIPLEPGIVVLDTDMSSITVEYIGGRVH